VILAHGYSLAKGVLLAQARQLAAHGLIVLAFSARGHGASTGAIEFDAPDYEGKDVRQLVDWLAARPEVQKDTAGDPRVGIAGGSYGGAISLTAAGLDNRIDAVVAQITWGDLTHAFAPNDDELARAEGVGGPLKATWLSLLFPEPCKPAADVCAPLTASRAAGHATPALMDALDARSPVRVADAIRAPTLLVQGERDTLLGLDEAVSTFDRIKSADPRFIKDKPVAVWATKSQVEGGNVVLDVQRRGDSAVYVKDTKADGGGPLLTDSQFEALNRFRYDPARSRERRRVRPWAIPAVTLIVVVGAALFVTAISSRGSVEG